MLLPVLVEVVDSGLCQASVYTERVLVDMTGEDSRAGRRGVVGAPPGALRPECHGMFNPTKPGWIFLEDGTLGAEAGQAGMVRVRAPLLEGLRTGQGAGQLCQFMF